MTFQMTGSGDPHKPPGLLAVRQLSKIAGIGILKSPHERPRLDGLRLTGLGRWDNRFLSHLPELSFEISQSG